MTSLVFWNDSWTAALGNHIWQSTVVVAVAWLLAFLLRRNQARTRYWVWMVASIKFLIPFALLIALGGRFAWVHGSARASAGFSMAMERVNEPFATMPGSPVAVANSPLNPSHAIFWILVATWAAGFLTVLSVWCARWRQVRLLLRQATPLRQGREAEALRRMEQAAGIQRPIGILTSASSLEPGIFGILHPVLLWPQNISERFDDAQMEAVVAHELEHVRHRDNVAALLHMLMEAIFWFYPLVWWLGARLVEERERACDEAVVESGRARQTYAESILKTCEFCLGSPLPCVSGVTGSDLKKRIIRIMCQGRAEKLSAGRKTLLTAIGVTAIAGPTLFGLLKPTRALAQLLFSDKPLPSFEVASIKPNKSGGPGMHLSIMANRFTAVNVTPRTLIEFAYDIKSDDQLTGAPSWINSEKYDVDAKVDDATAEKLKSLSRDESGDQIKLMMQALLAERFNLKVGHDTKDLPVFALVVAKGGPKLTPSKLPPLPPGTTPPPPGPQNFRGIRMTGQGQIEGAGAAMSFLAYVLSRQAEVGHVVLDETGLKGTYDWTLKWTPEPGLDGPPAGPPGTPGGAASPPPDATGPSLFTALQEQLGLKLESRKAPAEVLVIDQIDQPTEN